MAYYVDRRRFHETFLDAARRIVSAPDADAASLAAAVVISQTACEALTHEAMVLLIDDAKLGPLGEAIKKYVKRFSRYSLYDDEHLLALWTSLTGDVIQQNKFWQGYATHVKRRNKAAHAGKDEKDVVVTKANAEHSIKYAGLYSEHVIQVLSAKGLLHLTSI